MQQRQKKNAKLFFLKNIIFFFLFCILTKNRKFPADEKSSVGQMFQSDESGKAGKLFGAEPIRQGIKQSGKNAA